MVMGPLCGRFDVGGRCRSTYRGRVKASLLEQRRRSDLHVADKAAAQTKENPMKVVFRSMIFFALFLGVPNVQAGTFWQVVERDSSLSFSVSIGGSNTVGHFENWSAAITYDPGTLESAYITAEIEIASVEIDSPKATSLIGTSRWLDSAGYPAARFVANGFSVLKDEIFTLPGMLTLKGVDVPVTLVGTLEIDGDIARADFEISLSRRAFGIGEDIPAVSDLVVVMVKLSAIRTAK